MPVDLADVKCTIKGVLNSSGTTLGLRELQRDYKNLDGREIPFADLGYSNLLTFLRAINDTVRLSDPESWNTFVFPVQDGKSDHISELVCGQKKNTKSSKSRFRGPNRFPPRRSYNVLPPRLSYNVLPPRLSYNVQPPRQVPERRFEAEEISNDFRRDVLRVLENKPEGFPTSEFDYHVRRVSYKHNLTTRHDELMEDLENYIDVKNERVFLRSVNPIVHRNGVIHRRPAGSSYHDDLAFSAGSEDDYEDDFDEYSSTHSNKSDEHVVENSSHPRPNLTNGNNAESNSHSNDDTLLENIPPRVIKNIQTLIRADENRNGIWLRDFLSKYLSKFSQELDVEECGCAEVLELVGKMKHIVHIKRYRMEGDHLLLDARSVQPVISEPEEIGHIPTSFISTLKKILIRRRHESLSTNDLPLEFQKMGYTLDPKEFGFSSMDSFLKTLEESCSEFHFRPVKDRILIRLNSIPVAAKSTQNPMKPILPHGTSFSPYPAEVCNADTKLPSDPLFESLKRNDVFPASLAEVYTPWRFYLHHSDNLGTLDRMMDDLNAFYVENHKEYEVVPTSIVKGLLCACTYSDNKWHRVSIMSTKLKTAKVKFVDYGTMGEKTVNELKYLHSDFAVYPAMSIRAKLTGVQAKSIPDPKMQAEYSTKLNYLFYDLTSTGTLDATFINFDPKQDCYEINLLCTPEADSPFYLSDRLCSEDWVTIKDERFPELPTGAAPSQFFTPQSLQSSKSDQQSPKTNQQPPKTNQQPPKTNQQSPKTNQQPYLKAENFETTEKPSTPPVAPVVSQPPPQPPPSQKGPPPGLSLPSGAQSQNYNNLFSPSSISNAELYGTPLIAQPPLLNPPFGPAPVNVPPAYMTGLSCATSFDPLLMPPTASPFGMPPCMPSSYVSTGFAQYPQPYYFNYPYMTPPAPPPPPNPFTQFLTRPPPPHVRPPPGFGPLNYAPPPSYASAHSQTGFVPAPPPTGRTGPVNGDIPRSFTYEPLVTTAPAAGTTTTKSSTANTFEWPLNDPELASQWEKKRSESVKSEDKGCRKNSKEHEATLSNQTEDPLLASVGALNLDTPPDSSLEDLLAIEKARERRGAESALKKCFDFSQSSEVIENVRTFLEAQTKSPSGASTSPKTTAESNPAPASPIPAAEPATDVWEPKPRTPDDVTLKLNAMLAKHAAEARAANTRTPSPLGASTPTTKDANLAGSPTRQISTPTASVDTASASCGVSPKVTKKPCKLDSIKQMVLKNRK